MKTYNDVAKEMELEEGTATRFIAYMRLRWSDPKDEDIKCRVGYAQEWAGRFKRGNESEHPIVKEKKVLEEIDA